MLNGIRLRNFQSHRDSELQFCEGINVIAGQSDSGKTAVLRAIDWVRLNRPRGTSIIHNGQKDAEVSILIPFFRIGKVRSSTRNGYEIEHFREIEVEKFDVVGSDVPVEVSQLLNLDDLNIQRQLDPHFLLFDSPGQIAAQVFQSCNLDRGLSALDRMQNDLRQAQRDHRGKDSEITELEEKLQHPYFQIIPKAEKLSQAAEALLLAISERTAKADRLDRTREELNRLDRAYLHLSSQIDKASPLIGQASQLERDISERTIQFRSLNSSHQELSAQRARLRSIPRLEKIDKLLESANEIHSKVTKREESISRLQALNRSLRLERSNQESIQSQIGRLDAQIKDAMKKTPICPTCGQEIRP